jgi:hypothetical protein
MFQVDKISDKLYGVVGLRQPFNPNYAILDAENQISRTGYYVTDNSYVKLEFIKDSNDYKDISDEDFNLFLKRMQQASIVNVCQRVFSRFDYLDRNLLYQNAQNKVNQETLIDGFVGYRIRVSSDKNIAFQIKRVLLDFDTNGDFKLMLFNTSELDPIFEEDITITDKTQAVELNWNVDNSGDTYKGDYYLGYVKTDTTPIPFKRDYENSDVMSYISHLDIHRMQVKGHSTQTLFDLTLDEGLSENIGLNPDIVVYEDYTDLIIQNEMLFGKAIELDMSISILREYLNSLRSNRNERIAESQASRIIAEVEGVTGDGVLAITGLRPQLIGEISAIRTEINKLITGYFNNNLRAVTLT